MPLGFHAVAQLVLAIQAVQFGEIQRRVVMVEKGLPIATLGQPAQPAQLHPADLRQIAVFDQKLLDFRVIGPLQARRQLVIRQVGLQRVVLEQAGVTLIDRLVALGQRTFGLVVGQALLGQGRCLDRLGAGKAKQQETGQSKETTAHENSVGNEGLRSPAAGAG